MRELRPYQNIFYVYLHIRPDTGNVFYVGKGKDKRAYHKYNRNRHWQNVVSKNAGVFIVKMIAEGLTYDEANKMEIEVIATYGKDNLCNITDGGEGNIGWEPSEETKAKISNWHKNKVVTDETKKKISNAVTGTIKGPRPLSVKQRISNKNSGENNGMFGRKISESARQKQRDKVGGENNYLSKPILHLQTGIFYATLQEAAYTTSIKRGTLWAMLSGRNKNKTSFIYA